MHDHFYLSAVQNVPIGLVVATTRATCVDGRETVGLQRGEGDRCHYWAKGTGFGTGSTTQSWDVEQALVRQRVEEEHVVWLVRLLAKYINPGLLLWFCLTGQGTITSTCKV